MLHSALTMVKARQTPPRRWDSAPALAPMAIFAGCNGTAAAAQAGTGALLLLLGVLLALIYIRFQRALRAEREASRRVSVESARLRTLTADLPAVLFEAAGPVDGRADLRWVSPNAHALLEASPAEILASGSAIVPHLPPEAIPGFADSLRAARRTGVWLWEGQLRLPSGRTRWVRGQARRGEPRAGEVRWTGFLADFTEEATLRHTLAQRERLATVGGMAAGVAHEINNPLSYIVGNIRYVADLAREGGIDLPDDAQDALHDAIEGAERVTRIVQDLRTLARGGEIGETIEAVDLRSVVETVGRLTELDLVSRARFVVDLAAELPAVRGNQDRLVQVLHNLVKNAALAIPPGDPAGNTVTVEARAAGSDRVVLRVMDTGPGVPAAIRERIFDPFFTTRDHTRGGQGTGLGLSVCLSIVHRLGGSLILEPCTGGGAVFRVELGAIPTASTAPARGGPTTDPGAPLRILVVDDDPRIVTSLARTLREHVVLGVSGVDAALALLDWDDAFDAVLCDLVMPGRSGVELLRELEVRRPALARRTVFMSGAAFSAEVRRWLDETSAPFVEKPVSRDELVPTLDRLAQAG